MKTIVAISLALLTALPLGACSTSGSSSMNTGQRISQRGTEIGDYGSDWSSGQHDVRQGRRIVDKSTENAADAEEKLARARSDMAKAEERLRKAQIERTNGEQMISGGTARMQQAEANYAAVRVGPSAIPNTSGN